MTKSFLVLSLFLSFQFAEAQDYVQGEILVKMKGRPSGSKSAAFMGEVSGKLALKSTFGSLNMHYMSLKAGEDMDQVLSELRQNPDIEYAEPNYILRRFDDVTPGYDDNRVFSVEEAGTYAPLSSSTPAYRLSTADTQMTQSWSQMQSGNNEVVVAVIDTGVDYNHTVFTETSSIWTNAGETPGNGIDDDANGYIDDVRGWNFYANTNNPMDDDDHGTHVAGVIVGAGQDIVQGPRVASKIKIMPLKFLGANGSGSTSSAIAAIYYAVRNHAQVINNSWGGASYSQALHDALAYAYSQGVVIVAAAGNNASNNDSVAMYPANYPVPSLISVAATNDWDALASFSNYGVSTVHMAAPGVGIYSTSRSNGFRYMSGTSMAAPFVSGLAALAIREAPNLSGYQIKNVVVNSSTYITGLVPRTTSGSRGHGLNTVVNSKTEVNTLSSQPSYVAVAPAGYRAPASETAPKAGCGLVSTSVLQQSWSGKGPGSGSSGMAGLFVVLSLLPIVVWQVLRTRALESPKNRRRFERFVMNSEIKVRVGDRELVGQMNTISMGGASFKADAMLERGGIVTLQIASPDGSEQVNVEGRVVWNEQNQSYGVQFAESTESARDSIKGWTKGLAKAS